MESSVTISVGAMRCRCCLAPGAAAKDLSSEYDWMGEKEVYADMLLESFDVRLKRIENAGWTICDTCITRLRDSTNFKKQVLYSEKTLLQGLTCDSSKPDISSDSKSENVKTEALSDDDDADHFEVQYLEEDIDLDENIKDISVKMEPLASTSEMSNDEDVPLSSLTNNAKRKVSSRINVSQIKSVGSISKLKQKAQAQVQAAKLKAQLQAQAKLRTQQLQAKLQAMKSQVKIKPPPGASKFVMNKMGQIKIVPKSGSAPMIKTGSQMPVLKKPVKITVKPGTETSTLKKITAKPPAKKGERFSTLRRFNRQGQIHFSAAVIEHSTATPFHVRRRNIICCVFKCYPDLPRTDTVNTLKTHLKEFHSNNLFRATNGYLFSSLRVDVTDLTCKICGHLIPNLEYFQCHLRSEHNIETFTDSGDVLVPYKLDSDNVCLICNYKAKDFMRLDEHMDNHFSVVICDICGKGLRDMKKLKFHVKSFHKERPHACEFCEAKFLTRSLLGKHVDYTHKGIGPNRCSRCPGLSFKGFLKKLEHMNEVHGEPFPKNVCETCGKTFVLQNHLKVHIEEVHTEKMYECNYCKEKFSSTRKLKKHTLAKHLSYKLPCIYCDRLYSNGCLGRHMKRKHTELERRGLCSRCGKPCGNSTTLAQHIKTEHADDVL